MDERFQQLRLLEAILFASAEPLAPGQLAPHLPEGADVGGLLEELSTRYANRGVNLVRMGERWAFRTAADLAPHMTLERSVTRKLSRAAVETLAIIAYHQPVTRGEIEEIRGVALSRGTLDTLLEAGWIRPRGRRRTPGKPVTWGTSEAFLDHFGLESLDALPGHDELKAAGLLDARPAIATLGDRGTLPEPGGGDAADPEADGADELESADPRVLLAAEFGEDSPVAQREAQREAEREAEGEDEAAGRRGDDGEDSSDEPSADKGGAEVAVSEQHR